MTGPLAEDAILDGKYRIEKFLGEGGMGIVYQAIEVDLERHVAIKLLKGELSGNAQLVQRFRDELRVLANFNHSNITMLYTSFNWQGMPAMVMELVEGETFRNMVYRRGPVPEEVSVPLVIQALQGVVEAHHRGIVHRDLKPENLMLNTEGTVKVMDFGIAKMEQTPGFTRTSATIGTPHYMSPEQIDPHRFGMTRADARTDIYSMGITLYEMLAGEVPFSGPSEFSVQRAHLEERPQSPTFYYPHIRPGVVAAVFRAMEKDPAQRYQTALDFSKALQAALAGAPVEVIAPPLPSSTKEEPAPALVLQTDKTALQRAEALDASPVRAVTDPVSPAARPLEVATTVAQEKDGSAEPALPANALDAVLNRWFGHTGRPRLVGAAAALLLLCLLGGGTVGVIALMTPRPVPESKGFSGGGSGSAAAAFQSPAQDPKPGQGDSTSSGDSSAGSGIVDIHLPTAGPTPKTGGGAITASHRMQLPPPPPQPAVAVAGIWTGSFTGCSGSGMTQAGMNLKETSAGSGDVVSVNGFMLVHTDTGNVKCGVDGTYRRANHSLVISSSCPASVPSFISAIHKSLLSVSGEDKMTGTVSPENCALASFHKD